MSALRRHADDELGPDDSLELDVDSAEVHEGNPHAQIAFTVPVSDRQLHTLAAIAEDRGTTIIRAIQRLIEDTVEERRLRERADAAARERADAGASSRVEAPA
jgi:hypothetical protein